MDALTVDIKTQDGVADGHVFHPPGDGPWPAILFYMDGLGVRPALFAMAERLSERGYYVLLPNLYYRAGPFAPFEPARVFGGGPERERLMALVRSVGAGLGTNDTTALGGPAMRDTAAFLDFLERQPEVRAGAVGCVGYCLGGQLAVLAAGTFPEKIAASASIHGGGLVLDRPDSPHQLAPKMRGTLYVGAAENDFTPEQLEKLREALTAGGVRFTLEVYPGAQHGFAVSDTPVYNREAAERQWERLYKLFGEALAPAREA